MITDEQLSAFIDGELPETDMEKIREALCEDETLSDRIAGLAAVDEIVAKASQCIDEVPLPDVIQALVAASADNNTAALASAQIIRPGIWQQAKQRWQQPLAAAAAVALVAGVSWNLMTQQPQHTLEAELVHVLETQPSGHNMQLDSDGSQVQPLLSFTHKDGRYCRYYQQQWPAGNAQESIACRTAGQWQQQVSAVIPASGEYQAASGSGRADEWLQAMLQGDPFSASKEQGLIQHHWQTDVAD